jgi:hypothetical protein
MDDAKDTFDVLADISLPELQHTQVNSNIADGPFAVEYGKDLLSLGAQLDILPTGMISFLLANKMKFIPKGTPVSVDTARQTITFGSNKGMVYRIRPLTTGDQKHFYPNLSFADLDEFKDFVAAKAWSILGDTSDPTTYGLTSEDGNVLGIFRQTSQGFFRREKGRWVKLNKDEASDWDDVDDKLWSPVLSGAIGVYDKAITSSDSIALDLFTPYIVS